MHLCKFVPIDMYLCKLASQVLPCFFYANWFLWEIVLFPLSLSWKRISMGIQTPHGPLKVYTNCQIRSVIWKEMWQDMAKNFKKLSHWLVWADTIFILWLQNKKERTQVHHKASYHLSIYIVIGLLNSKLHETHWAT